VVGLDVGHGQLHERLTGPVALEGLNARHLAGAELRPDRRRLVSFTDAGAAGAGALLRKPNGEMEAQR
jgi:predicted rRNA methylase YqxC with S4 and FtsJ domains